MKNKIKLFDSFAGYGGAHFALKKAKINHKAVGYSENDKFAIEIYELNHPGVKNFGDITKIKPEELPNFNFFTGGFPCQPFSQAGDGLGIKDTRGTLFHDIIRICEYKQPENILLENVKGLITARHKYTLRTIREELTRIGYNIHVQLLNSKHYGIPQNRERVWIYATKKALPLNFDLAPNPTPLEKDLKYFLDKNPEEHLYLNEKQIDRLIELHKVDFNVTEPCCLDIYNKKVRTDGICVTITEPHHNTMRIVEPPKNGKFIVRKVSTFEHFRLMGFDNGQIKFGDMSYSQICKRAGNGWDINIASIIVKNIFDFYYSN